MSADQSVSYWLDLLKAGDVEAARPLWQRYFGQLVRLAQRRLHGASRAAADEEDVALSAFQSFCAAAEQGRFPRLDDRDDLWRLLVVITERKASNQVRDQRRLKRGGGQVLGESALEGMTPSADGPPGLGQVPGREPTPAFAAQVAEACQHLLEKLGDETLRQVALFKMEGYTNQEIAAARGVVVRSIERKLVLIRRIWESDAGMDPERPAAE